MKQPSLLEMIIFHKNALLVFTLETTRKVTVGQWDYLSMLESIGSFCMMMRDSYYYIVPSEQILTIYK